MFVGHISEVEQISYDGDNVKNVIKQVAIGKKEGWDDYVLRVFTVKNGGFTPKHKHDWPHINYILNGEGTLFLNGELHHIKSGSIAYIPNNIEHQFRADKGYDLQLICIVPEKGDY